MGWLDEAEKRQPDAAGVIGNAVANLPRALALIRQLGDALAAVRPFVAANEPDPQHNTVTISAALSVYRDAIKEDE